MIILLFSLYDYWRPRVLWITQNWTTSNKIVCNRSNKIRSKFILFLILFAFLFFFLILLLIIDYKYNNNNNKMNNNNKRNRKRGRKKRRIIIIIIIFKFTARKRLYTCHHRQHLRQLHHRHQTRIRLDACHWYCRWYWHWWWSDTPTTNWFGESFFLRMANNNNCISIK